MNWAARLIGRRFHYGWLTVAVVYLAMTGSLSLVVSMLERRFKVV